jgi:hypothetical protein
MRARVPLFIAGALVVVVSSVLGIWIPLTFRNVLQPAEIWVVRWAAAATTVAPYAALVIALTLLAIAWLRGDYLKTHASIFAFAIFLEANLACVSITAWLFRLSGLGDSFRMWEHVFDLVRVKALFALWVVGWLCLLLALALQGFRNTVPSRLRVGLVAVSLPTVLLASSIVAAGAADWLA